MNERLATSIYQPLKPNGKGIMFINGWMSNRSSPAPYSENLAAKGYHCLTFDLRGMGESEGDIQALTRKDFLDDCLEAYELLRQVPGVHSVHVVGASFGAYLACLLAGNREVESLVLRVPADFTDKGFDDQPQIVLSDELDKQGLMGPRPDSESSYALEALAKFSGKVLVVESENDTVVGPAMVARFVKAAPSKNVTHVVMKGAPHSLSTSPEHKTQFGRILDDWFVD
jgi:uncharacterized protein